LWDLPSGTLVKELDVSDQVVRFNPRRTSMLTQDDVTGTDGVAIWDTETGVRLWKAPAEFKTASYDANGKRLFAEGTSGFVVFDLDEKGVPRDGPSHVDYDDGSFAWESLDFVSTGLGAELKRRHPEKVREDCYPLTIDPTGAVVICGQAGKDTPLLFTLNGLEFSGRLDRFKLGYPEASGARFSPDGARFGFVRYYSPGAAAGVWSINTRQFTPIRREVPGSGSFQFSGDSKRVFISRDDDLQEEHSNIVDVFDAASGTPLHKLQHPHNTEPTWSPSSHLEVLWLNATGDRAVTRTMHGLFLWNVDQERVVRSWNLYAPEQERYKTELAFLYRLNEYRNREPMVSSVTQLLPVAKRLLRHCP
jgi:hypothetical protein